MAARSTTSRLVQLFCCRFNNSFKDQSCQRKIVLRSFSSLNKNGFLQTRMRNVRYMCQKEGEATQSDPPEKKPSVLSSLAIFITGVGVTLGYLYYLHLDKQRIKEEEAMKKRKNIKVGGPFTLSDHTGKVTTDKDFLGKWQLIYFGFTHCPDICPTEMEKMHEALAMLEKKKNLPEIKPIFISVDPERDDVKAVAEYLKDFHPNMVGLTGTVQQVKDVCKVFRVYFSAGEPDQDHDYIVDHTTLKYLMNPEGKLEDYYGQGSTSKEMAKSIEKHIKIYNREKNL